MSRIACVGGDEFPDELRRIIERLAAEHPDLGKDEILLLAAHEMRGNKVDDARILAAGQPPGSKAAEILKLDSALESVAAEHPRLRQIVVLRFFAQVGERESAAALGISLRTLRREWHAARALLYNALP